MLGMLTGSLRERCGEKGCEGQCELQRVKKGFSKRLPTNGTSSMTGFLAKKETGESFAPKIGAQNVPHEWPAREKKGGKKTVHAIGTVHPLRSPAQLVSSLSTVAATA